MQHCTLFLTLQPHYRLDNQSNMEGQSFPFISFTQYNFYAYFTQSEIVFLTDHIEVTLHTSFCIAQGSVPHFSTTKFANTLTPLPSPKRFRVLFLRSCRNIVLGAASVPSVLGTILRIISEDYLSCRTIFMLLPISGSK